jgi:hypothetical protein
MSDYQPYYTIRSRRPADGHGARQGEGPPVCFSPTMPSRFVQDGTNIYLTLKPINAVGDGFARSATHDTSRTSFHVKHIGAFARRLEDVCFTPAIGNRVMGPFGIKRLIPDSVGNASISKQRSHLTEIHQGSGSPFALGLRRPFCSARTGRS